MPGLTLHTFQRNLPVGTPPGPDDIVELDRCRPRQRHRPLRRPRTLQDADDPGPRGSRAVLPQRHRRDAGGRGSSLRDFPELQLHPPGARGPGGVPERSLISGPTTGLGPLPRPGSPARRADRSSMTNKPAGEPPAVPSEARPASRRLLGEFFVGEGLITRRQLDAALQLQAEHRPQAPLGELLVEQGAIRPEQVYAVLDKHRLGNLLVSMELLTSEQLESALLRQRMTGRRLAEVVLQLRYVTEDQLRQALARHFGIRLVTRRDTAGSRTRAPDRARLRLAAPPGADRPGRRPADRRDGRSRRPLGHRDLARVTGCRIEVVTASSRALRRAFVRIYGDRTPASTAHELEARHVETRASWPRCGRRPSRSARALRRTPRTRRGLRDRHSLQGDSPARADRRRLVPDPG